MSRPRVAEDATQLHQPFSPKKLLLLHPVHIFMVQWLHISRNPNQFAGNGEIQQLPAQAVLVMWLVCEEHGMSLKHVFLLAKRRLTSAGTGGYHRDFSWLGAQCLDGRTHAHCNTPCPLQHAMPTATCHTHCNTLCPLQHTMPTCHAHCNTHLCL